MKGSYMEMIGNATMVGLAEVRVDDMVSLS